jgi:fibronectin-binding autotransporter adhesin
VATGFSSARNIALGHAASTIQVDPAQIHTINGVVSGSGALNKTGDGGLTLTGENTFTGATVVNAGILTALSGSETALGTSSGLTVNSGGTLLMGASDQISDAVPVTLAGGTIAKGNFSEGSATAIGLGALTLIATGSHLDFGSGIVGHLSFASFVPGANTLAIDDWTGSGNTIGSATTDRLIFNQDQTANLSSFNFTGYADGGTQFSLGGGFYEVIPITAVPEPATFVAGALTLIALGYHQRGRFLRRGNSAL